jgi:SAM-dependent methyltransferase
MGDQGPDTERPSNFYDSPYLAEYYDLRVKANKKPPKVEDAFIFLSLFERDLRRRGRTHQISQDNPFTVLDVGTGTGRVLVNLVNDAVHAGIDLSNVELIGVDREPAMVQRSKDVEKETESMARAGKVTWALGEAVSLTSVPALQNRLDRVDTLIFALGSISHLISPEEPRLFFFQVATLPTPKSGRAYITIQNDLISYRSRSLPPRNPDTAWLELKVARDLPSKLHPGIIYRQYPPEKSEIKDQIRTDQYRFQVVREADSGVQEVIENNKITMSLRIWDEAQFFQWAKDAGLHCFETVGGDVETYYYIFTLSDPQVNTPVPRTCFSPAALFRWSLGACYR